MGVEYRHMGTTKLVRLVLSGGKQCLSCYIAFMRPRRVKTCKFAYPDDHTHAMDTNTMVSQAIRGILGPSPNCLTGRLASS